MHGFGKVDSVQTLNYISAVDEHLAAFYNQSTFGVSYDIRTVHLHQGRFNEKASLARARPADADNVFVSCVFWVFRTAAHSQSFCLSKRDVLIKVRVDEWFDVTDITPTGRAVF